MELRLTPERKRSLIASAQTTRTAIAIIAVNLAVILLVQADPHHQYALAFLDAAHNWAHAAFPQLIK